MHIKQEVRPLDWINSWRLKWWISFTQGKGALASNQPRSSFHSCSFGWLLNVLLSHFDFFFPFGMPEGYLSHDRILKLSVRFGVSKCHSSINITKYILIQCMRVKSKACQSLELWIKRSRAICFLVLFPGSLCAYGGPERHWAKGKIAGRWRTLWRNDPSRSIKVQFIK